MSVSISVRVTLGHESADVLVDRAARGRVEVIDDLEKAVLVSVDQPLQRVLVGHVEHVEVEGTVAHLVRVRARVRARARGEG